ncbi:MAG: VirB8/TrbF family protein [Proteobacteria bacterium]|nr:VirB8/TrbF family protein [Pseudomonadota bacterium]
MANTLEPPVLLSRLMTFVFAGAVAVVIILILTVTRIFPLQRTQVFFLTTQPRNDVEISLTTLSVNDQNLALYKESFLKEYIKARNEIIPNAGVMTRKWQPNYNGMVYTWSSPDVFAAFAATKMVTAMRVAIPEFEFRCSVNFKDKPAPRAENRFAVSFTYSCVDNAGQPMSVDNSGQPASKDYTIVIQLEMQPRIRWSERLRNPLGIKVVEYTIESGGGDPLDFGQ